MPVFYALKAWFTDEDFAVVVGRLAVDLLTPPGAPVAGIPPLLEEKLRYGYPETVDFLKDILQRPVEVDDAYNRFQARFPRTPLTRDGFRRLGAALAQLGILERQEG